MIRNVKKLLWKPGTMLYPVPALLVSCGEFAGERNIVTVAWTGVACTEPPMCTIALRPQRHSYDLIRRRGEFALNLTTAAMVRAGYFDLASFEPLCYCHGHYYEMGRHIGKFGFSVEKKRRKRPATRA